jgi:hypothetical protein
MICHVQNHPSDMGLHLVVYLRVTDMTQGISLHV